MNSNKINRILYVIVLPEESQAILDKEKFVKDEERCKEYSNIMEAFVQKRDNNHEIVIIRPIDDPLHCTPLFGTEISFFVTYIGIKLFQPDLVISIGYAGEVAMNDEVEKSLGIGSVVIAKEKSVYHRREMIIKFYEKTSQGLYPLLSCDKMVTTFGFHSCSVGTSNSFSYHDNVASLKNLKVVEMELCSVARACHYFNTPCIGVKIISDGGPKDLSEEERAKQFLDSLPLLKEMFYETYEKVNGFILSKIVEDL